MTTQQPAHRRDVSALRPIAESVAVITGGAGGIGRATACALARRGAKAVLVDRESDRVGVALDELSQFAHPDHTLGLALDVRSVPDLELMVDRVVSRFGRIDILVCAAGVLRAGSGVPRPLHRMTLEEWRLILDTNLTGVFLANRAVLPVMIRQRSGQIINIASTSGLEGRAFDGAYCASKAGVLGLSEAAARETVRYGVRINALLPGAVDTELWNQNGPIATPSDALPPERIAEVVVYLVTMPADSIIWEPVVVASGLSSRRERRDG